MTKPYHSKHKQQALDVAYRTLVNEQKASVMEHLQLLNAQQHEIEHIHQMASEIELTCLHLIDPNVSKILTKALQDGFNAYQIHIKKRQSATDIDQRQELQDAWLRQMNEILDNAEQSLKSISDGGESPFQYAASDLGMLNYFLQHISLGYVNPAVHISLHTQKINQLQHVDITQMRQDAAKLREVAEVKLSELNSLEAQSMELKKKTFMLEAKDTVRMNDLSVLIDLHERTQRQIKSHFEFFNKTMVWTEKLNQKQNFLSEILKTQSKTKIDFPMAQVIMDNILSQEIDQSLRFPGYAVSKAMLELEAPQNALTGAIQHERNTLMKIVREGLSLLMGGLEQQDTDKAKASKKMKRK